MFARGLKRCVFPRPSNQWLTRGRSAFEHCVTVGCLLGSLRITQNKFHSSQTLSSSETMSIPNNSRSFFEGIKDRFEGVTVDSTEETCDISSLPAVLNASLEKWREAGVRGVWFKVALADSAWVPLLAKNGFRFHHAQPSYVMMVCWLPSNEVCNIPQYGNTLVGVGAIVINDKRQILVVSEKYRLFPHWKLPGGYVEPGEEIVNAAEREVLEETSVRAKFKQMISFRHVHNFTFGCSDLYFIVVLTPEPCQDVLKKCEREIAAVEWMSVDEYLSHPNVHSTNRFFVQKYLECEASGVSITYHQDTHQLLKKPYIVYSIDLGPHKATTDQNDDAFTPSQKL